MAGSVFQGLRVPGTFKSRTALGKLALGVTAAGNLVSSRTKERDELTRPAPSANKQTKTPFILFLLVSSSLSPHVSPSAFPDLCTAGATARLI